MTNRCSNRIYQQHVSKFLVRTCQDWKRCVTCAPFPSAGSRRTEVAGNILQLLQHALHPVCPGRGHVHQGARPPQVPVRGSRGLLLPAHIRGDPIPGLHDGGGAQLRPGPQHRPDSGEMACTGAKHSPHTHRRILGQIPLVGRVIFAIGPLSNT